MEQIDAMFEGSVDSEVLDQTAPAMEVVTPVLIRSYGVRGGSGGAVNRATGAAFSWDSVFLTSDGHVTSYGADGRRQWVSATPASWRPSDNRLDSDGTASLNVGAQTLDVDASVLPTLAVFSPVPHEEGGFVLAADSQQLAILTSDGEVQHTIALPDFPTAPVSVGMDFDSDGLNDVIVCVQVLVLSLGALLAASFFLSTGSPAFGRGSQDESKLK